MAIPGAGGESATIVMKDSEVVLTVKDKDGRVIFQGPVGTEEQRKALPPEIRNKVDVWIKPGKAQEKAPAAPNPPTPPAPPQAPVDGRLEAI